MMQTDDRTQPLATSNRPADALRGGQFVVKKRRWPGFVAAGLVGGAVAAAIVSGLYDDRSVGQRLDAGVANASQKLEQGVGTAQQAASGVVEGTAEAMSRVGEALTDANITAAVKAALATDPGLSAVAIEVTTQDGVVRLDGPAPDAKARERATVIAAAPQGVSRVDNRLVVPMVQ
jgi:hyperosmotically inducible periplasmic protein